MSTCFFHNFCRWFHIWSSCPEIVTIRSKEMNQSFFHNLLTKRCSFIKNSSDQAFRIYLNICTCFDQFDNLVYMSENCFVSLYMRKDRNISCIYKILNRAIYMNRHLMSQTPLKHNGSHSSSMLSLVSDLKLSLADNIIRSQGIAESLDNTCASSDHLNFLLILCIRMSKLRTVMRSQYYLIHALFPFFIQQSH